MGLTTGYVSSVSSSASTVYIVAFMPCLEIPLIHKFDAVACHAALCTKARLDSMDPTSFSKGASGRRPADIKVVGEGSL